MAQPAAGHERQPLLSQQQQQPFLAPLSPGLSHAPASSSSNGAGTGNGPTFNPSLYPVYNDPFSVESLRRADRRARRRAIFTVVLGFMAWTLLGLLVTIIGGEGAGLLGDHRPSWSRNRWPGPLPRQPAQDGNITSSGCADFLRTLPSSGSRSSAASDEDPPHTLYKTKSFFHFELDEQEGIFLLGKGRYSNGPVHVVVEEPKSHKGLESVEQGKPVVEIEIMAIWNDKDLLRTIKVCPLVRDASTAPHDWLERGVGIYTPAPSYTEPGKRLSFEVVIRLPPSSSSPSTLRSLFVHGENFYPLSVAASPFAFGSVDLKSINGVVTIPAGNSLAGKEIRAYASNGRIDGTFNVFRELRLESANGPIRAQVNLIEGESEAIDVHASTSNGYVDLTYAQHPVGLLLRSDARTSNGDAKVRHAPTFEGDFSLRTSLGRAVVEVDKQAKDPTGEHRERKLEITKDDPTFGAIHKAGRVYWDSLPSAHGSSNVETSLGIAAVYF